MADDPNAPKTYRRPSGGVPAAPTPAVSTTAATVAADPNAPATYKRPASETAPPAQPDPKAYKPPDWIPGAGFLYKTNRVFENALTAGLIDPATAAVGNWMRGHGVANTTPSTAQLRAETAQDKKDVGPVAAGIADTAGYAMGPGKVLGPLAGRFAPIAGRYGAAAAEGAAANAVDAAGNQVGSDQPLNYWDTGKHIAAGALTGVAGQGIGDATSRVAGYVANKVQGFPGRSAENWVGDWRNRTAAGEDVRPDIQRWRDVTQPPRGSAEDLALTNLNNALGQSTDPGLGFQAAQAAAGTAAAGLGLSEGMHFGESIVPGGIGAGAVRWLGDKAARGINTVDRNINVGQAFDQAYPALYGRTSTTDTSGWADALRQLSIGSQSQR